MISQIERFVFLGEVRLKTFRNLFMNDVPTAMSVFSELLKLHSGGNSHTLSLPPKELKLVEFKISNSRYAEMLFRMTDPSIPDNVLSDRQHGTLRTAARMPTEDPAVSAHVVVDLSASHDHERLYPTAIENIDFLPRSLIVNYFNEWMTNELSETRERPEKKDKKTYQPRIEFVAPHSQTIAGALESGGVLTGVKWVEDRMEQKSFGDQAYPIEQRTDVAIKVKNRPTGDAAKKILTGAWDKARGKHPKTFKVTIEDENDRSKTIGIDPTKNNVLSNLFIPQVRIDNFASPAAMCEGAIRGDIIQKMKSSLPK